MESSEKETSIEESKQDSNFDLLQDYPDDMSIRTEDIDEERLFGPDPDEANQEDDGGCDADENLKGSFNPDYVEADITEDDMLSIVAKDEFASEYVEGGISSKTNKFEKKQLGKDFSKIAKWLSEGNPDVSGDAEEEEHEKSTPNSDKPARLGSNRGNSSIRGGIERRGRGTDRIRNFERGRGYLRGRGSDRGQGAVRGIGFANRMRGYDRGRGGRMIDNRWSGREHRGGRMNNRGISRGVHSRLGINPDNSHPGRQENFDPNLSKKQERHFPPEQNGHHSFGGRQLSNSLERPPFPVRPRFDEPFNEIQQPMLPFQSQPRFLAPFKEQTHFDICIPSPGLNPLQSHQSARTSSLPADGTFKIPFIPMQVLEQTRDAPTDGSSEPSSAMSKTNANMPQTADNRSEDITQVKQHQLENRVEDIPLTTLINTSKSSSGGAAQSFPLHGDGLLPIPTTTSTPSSSSDSQAPIILKLPCSFHSKEQPCQIPSCPFGHDLVPANKDHGSLSAAGDTLKPSLQLKSSHQEERRRLEAERQMMEMERKGREKQELERNRRDTQEPERNRREKENRNNRLFVSHLSLLTDDEIEDMFSPYGKIEDVVRGSKEYGFLEYASALEAQQAIDDLDPIRYKNFPSIRVRFAVRRKEDGFKENYETGHQYERKKYERENRSGGSQHRERSRQEVDSKDDRNQERSRSETDLRGGRSYKERTLMGACTDGPLHKKNDANKTLFVNRLSELTEQEVKDIFSPYGELENIKFGSKEYGFVTFVSIEHAQDALHSLKGYQLKSGHSLGIEFAKKKQGLEEDENQYEMLTKLAIFPYVKVDNNSKDNSPAGSDSEKVQRRDYARDQSPKSGHDAIEQTDFKHEKGLKYRDDFRSSNRRSIDTAKKRDRSPYRHSKSYEQDQPSWSKASRDGQEEKELVSKRRRNSSPNRPSRHQLSAYQDKDNQRFYDDNASNGMQQRSRNNSEDKDILEKDDSKFKDSRSRSSTSLKDNERSRSNSPSRKRREIGQPNELPIKELKTMLPPRREQQTRQIVEDPLKVTKQAISPELPQRSSPRVVALQDIKRRTLSSIDADKQPSTAEDPSANVSETTEDPVNTSIVDRSRSPSWEPVDERSLSPVQNISPASLNKDASKKRPRDPSPSRDNLKSKRLLPNLEVGTVEQSVLDSSSSLLQKKDERAPIMNSPTESASLHPVPEEKPRLDDMLQKLAKSINVGDIDSAWSMIKQVHDALKENKDTRVLTQLKKDIETLMMKIFRSNPNKNNANIAYDLLQVKSAIKLRQEDLIYCSNIQHAAGNYERALALLTQLQDEFGVSNESVARHLYIEQIDEDGGVLQLWPSTRDSALPDNEMMNPLLSVVKYDRLKEVLTKNDIDVCAMNIIKGTLKLKRESLKTFLRLYSEDSTNDRLMPLLKTINQPSLIDHITVDAMLKLVSSPEEVVEVQKMLNGLPQEVVGKPVEAWNNLLVKFSSENREHSNIACQVYEIIQNYQVKVNRESLYYYLNCLLRARDLEAYSKVVEKSDLLTADEGESKIPSFLAATLTDVLDSYDGNELSTLYSLCYLSLNSETQPAEIVLKKVLETLGKKRKFPQMHQLIMKCFKEKFLLSQLDLRNYIRCLELWTANPMASVDVYKEMRFFHPRPEYPSSLSSIDTFADKPVSVRPAPLPIDEEIPTNPFSQILSSPQFNPVTQASPTVQVSPAGQAPSANRASPALQNELDTRGKFENSPPIRHEGKEDDNGRADLTLNAHDLSKIAHDIKKYCERQKHGKYVELFSGLTISSQENEDVVLEALFTGMLQKPLNANQDFKEFIDMLAQKLNPDGEEDFLFDDETSRALGRLGLRLMLYLHSSSNDSHRETFSVLSDLHKFNIAYSECGAGFGANVATRNDMNLLEICNLCCSVCLCQKPPLNKSCLTVLQCLDFGLTVKDVKRMREHYPQEIKQRETLLRTLLQNLVHELLLDEAWELFTRINIHESVALPDMNSLCNFIWHSFCDRNNYERVEEISLYMTQKGITQETGTFRAYVNCLANNRRELIARREFLNGVTLGIYPATFNATDPLLLQLPSSFTIVEMQYLLENHMKMWSSHRSYPNSREDFRNDHPFRIVIYPESSVHYDQFDIVMSDAASRLSGLLADRMNPPLNWVQRKEYQFEVTQGSIRRWIDAVATSGGGNVLHRDSINPLLPTINSTSRRRTIEISNESTNLQPGMLNMSVTVVPSVSSSTIGEEQSDDQTTTTDVPQRSESSRFEEISPVQPDFLRAPVDERPDVSIKQETPSSSKRSHRHSSSSKTIQLTTDFDKAKKIVKNDICGQVTKFMREGYVEKKNFSECAKLLNSKYTKNRRERKLSMIHDSQVHEEIKDFVNDYFAANGKFFPRDTNKR